MGLDAYGIDFSESNGLRERFKKVDLQKDKYPFEDETFDIIFSKSVIEHLQNPDFLFDEAYRLLKPNGVFICMTPSWKHSYKEQFYIDHTHVTPFTRHSLELICELSGFDAGCEYFYQLPLLWKFPALNIFRIILNFFRLPYRPFDRVKIWSDEINKIIRFSREAMLLAVATKRG